MRCSSLTDPCSSLPAILLSRSDNSSTGVSSTVLVAFVSWARLQVVGPQICSEEMVEQFKDRMSSSGDADEMQTVCAMAILNLTEDHRNHAALLRGGIVPELLRLLLVREPRPCPHTLHPSPLPWKLLNSDVSVRRRCPTRRLWRLQPLRYSVLAQAKRAAEKLQVTSVELATRPRPSRLTVAAD